MSTQKHEKINQLILNWPPGTIKTARALRAQGVGASLARRYVQGGWLAPVNPDSRGAYMRAGDRVDWTGALYALQEAQGERIYVGGRTALEMQGFAHYAAAKTRGVFLFGPPKRNLPPWFTRRDWGARIVFTATALFSLTAQELISLAVRDYTVRIASPEQAALEMLFHVPERVGFDEAGQIMAGLGTVRPTVAQKLLEECGSIRAKRLFLYFAKSAGHAWLSSLDVSRVNLGSGNRQIIKGGRLDKEYLITIPQQAQSDGVLF